MAFTRASGAVYAFNSSIRCGGFYWPTNLTRIIGYRAKIGGSISPYCSLYVPSIGERSVAYKTENDFQYFHFGFFQYQIYNFFNPNDLLYNAYNGFTDGNFHDIPFISSTGIMVSPPALNTGNIESIAGKQVSNATFSFSGSSTAIIETLEFNATAATAYYTAIEEGDGSFEEINGIGRVHSERAANIYITGVDGFEVKRNITTGEFSTPEFSTITEYRGRVYLYHDNSF